MQRSPFAQRDAHETAPRGLRRLADRLRHLARLAMSEADAALLVADDDERREVEAPAALHHLGHPVDVHEAVDELAVPLLALALGRISRHDLLSIAAGLASRRLFRSA